MDLGNVLQVLLFLLPGFLFIRTFFLFIPARKEPSDAAVIVMSIAASAGLWVLASVALLLASGIVDFFGWISRQGWHVDLWSAWLQPALTFRNFTGTDVIPGLLVNIAGVVIGAWFASMLLEESGAIRIINWSRLPGFLKELRLDLNPRVWNWFFQGGEARRSTSPAAGPIIRATPYRVTLTDHSILLGQVTEYSLDPNDDTFDLVLRQVSVWRETEWVPVAEADAMLIQRENILLAERLDGSLSTAPPPSPLFGSADHAQPMA
jgi:Family of unknown function (DUF6338)